MYKHNAKQLLLPHEFFMPFEGQLNPENRWCKLAVFVKLVVAIPNKFHCSYDALLYLGLDSFFERSGLSQTVSSNVQSLVEPVQRSGCLAFANS